MKRQKRGLQGIAGRAFAGLFAAATYGGTKQKKCSRTTEIFPAERFGTSSAYKSPTDNVTTTQTIPCEDQVKLTKVESKPSQVENIQREIPQTEDNKGIKGKSTGVVAGVACAVTSPAFLAIVGVGVVLGGAYYIWRRVNRPEVSEQTSSPPPNSRAQPNDNRPPHDSSRSRYSNRSRNSEAGNEVVSSAGNGGNDQQPPSRNPIQTSESESNSLIDYFLTILEDILEVRFCSLDQVSIRGQHLFQNLNKVQKNSLKKVIKPLKNKGLLKRVLQTIVNIFNTEKIEDINFVNFLSWIEFITNYLEESSKRKSQLFHDENDCSETYNERRQAVIDIVGTQIPQYEYTILRVFREILAQIEEQIIPVKFRNIHSAVYHYYKHRIVNIHELQVSQYYNIIQENLDIIMQSMEYTNLLGNGTQVTYMRYYAQYGRRLLIILKKNGQRVDLCTCYFINEVYDDDNDGDTYINGNFYNF